MAMENPRRRYRFGSFQIDCGERVLFRDSEPVTLTGKAFDTLLALVERHGHVVGKRELMDRIWPATHVDENNLAQNISLLRKVFDSAEPGHEYIETVPRRGYRFLGEVHTDDNLPTEGKHVVR